MGFNFNRFCLDAYPSPFVLSLSPFVVSRFPFVVSLSNHEFSATPGSRFTSFDKLRTNGDRRIDGYIPFVVSLSNHEFSATPGWRLTSFDKLRTNGTGGGV